MDIKQYVKQTFDYSYWANQRYFAVAEGLTDEQLRRKQEHSWGDVPLGSGAHDEFGDVLAQTVAC